MLEIFFNNDNIFLIYATVISITCTVIFALVIRSIDLLQIRVRLLILQRKNRNLLEDRKNLEIELSNYKYNQTETKKDEELKFLENYISDKETEFEKYREKKDEELKFLKNFILDTEKELDLERKNTKILETIRDILSNSNYTDEKDLVYNDDCVWTLTRLKERAKELGLNLLSKYNWDSRRALGMLIREREHIILIKGLLT